MRRALGAAACAGVGRGVATDPHDPAKLDRRDDLDAGTVRRLLGIAFRDARESLREAADFLIASRLA